MSDRPTGDITGYHAHVYYRAETKPEAARLRQALADRFDVRLGRWHDRPVGPHPCWSYQVAFEPALFGTALVGLPYFLRKELGRYGALATAVLLTVSPSMLYFGRFIRNDIFMAVWALSLLIVMWHYMERPRTALLIVWTVLWALALATKESSYLTVGSFGLFLLVLAAPPIWRWVRGLGSLSDMTPAGDLLIVLGTLSLLVG